MGLDRLYKVPPTYLYDMNIIDIVTVIWTILRRTFQTLIGRISRLNKHPRGKDCPCPKHEYIREQVNIAKAISNNRREISPEHRQKYSGHPQIMSRSL